MRKTSILLIGLILFSTAFSGCWDYTEYESMAQIISTGVDYNKETNELTITYQYVPTSKSGQSSGMGNVSSSSLEKEIVNSVTDRTFYGAIQKMQQVIMKKLFYGYMKVIVVGEEAAKYKMMDLIEFFDRTPSLRTTAYIAITSGKAENVLSIDDPSGVLPIGDQIYEQITEAKSTSTAYPTTIEDFSAMLAIGGLEATLPRIVSTVQKYPGPVAEGGILGNKRFDDRITGDLMISGTAVFKDDKLIGWLNDKESMGYGWITGKKILAYKVSEHSEDENTEDILYFRVNGSKTKMKIAIENNMPAVHLNIKVKADLRKYYTKKGSEFLTPDEIKRMEKKLSDSIRADIEAALEKGQKELASDIFGFGFAVFRKSPSLWKTKYEKEWSEIFPDIPVYVKIDARITNTGTNIKKLIVK